MKWMHAGSVARSWWDDVFVCLVLLLEYHVYHWIHNAVLPATHFKIVPSDEELMARCDERVDEDDWEWLINHWRSPKAQARAAKGKMNRSKVVTPHTAGSMSFARVGHDWSKEMGRKPRRDELFVKTHTRKNGVPLPQAVPKINALREAITNNPELKKKTVEEGDAVSHVFGREKRGYVRCVGLGPTPSSLGMIGHRKYIPTKIQMALHGRRKAEHQVTLLQGTVENLREEVAEMRRQLMGNYHGRREDTPNGDSTPHGSNRVMLSGEHEQESEPEDYELESNINPDEDQNQMLMNRRVAAPPTRHQAQPTRHQGGGKEVILISLIGASNTRVAMATVQTTDPRAIVGGTALGKDCSEVVVNFVMKRDAPLYRPYGKMKTMADAVGQSIAWPHKRMLDVEQSKRSSQECLGNSRRH